MAVSAGVALGGATVGIGCVPSTLGVSTGGASGRGRISRAARFSAMAALSAATRAASGWGRAATARLADDMGDLLTVLRFSGCGAGDAARGAEGNVASAA